MTKQNVSVSGGVISEIQRSQFSVIYSTEFRQCFRLRIICWKQIQTFKQIWIWQNLGTFYCVFNVITKNCEIRWIFFCWFFSILFILLSTFHPPYFPIFSSNPDNSPLRSSLKLILFLSHLYRLINLHSSFCFCPIVTDLLIFKHLLFVNCTKHKTKNLL